MKLLFSLFDQFLFIRSWRNTRIILVMTHVNMSMRLNTFVGMSKIYTYSLIMIFVIISYMFKCPIFDNCVDPSGSM